MAIGKQWLTSLFRLPFGTHEEGNAVSKPTPEPELGVRIYSARPFLVYTNLGDEGNFVPVKQFATRKETEDWMVMQAAERPGYYEVIHQSEFDIV